MLNQRSVPRRSGWCAEPRAAVRPLGAAIAALLSALVAAGCADRRPDPGPPAGYRALFNGRDLSGWRESTAAPPGGGHWRVEAGMLVFDGRGDSLRTEEDFGDFELLLDWRIGPGGDSGIYLRGTPQVQIWDDPVGSGGLFNNERGPSRPLTVADRPVGDWNTFRIAMRGERVSVWLNGTLVVDDVVLENYWDRSRPLADRGPIELQAHGSPLWFRNIFVRESSE